MKCSSPSKIDRVTHHNFVSSLRTWCNADTDLIPSDTDLKLAWINQISERLLVGAKVDLTKVVSLDGLSRVEVDFLKLAVPNLAYFAKSPHSTTTNEASLLLLQSWDGVPISLSDSDSAVASILINKLKFKNIILKLLTNASNDKRITRMRSFIVNPTEMDLSRSTSSDDDEISPSNTSNGVDSPQCSHPNQSTAKMEIMAVIALTVNTILEMLVYTIHLKVTHSRPLHSQLKLFQGMFNRRRVPKLHIEYVEPTPDLLSSNYVCFKSRSPRRYYHHSCFSEDSKDTKWAESLRGGFIPSHFRFNS
nr:hypothetical protein MACL_00000711 [Theileria orientalis]